MLSAIREIGKWQINKSGKDELEVLTKEPKLKVGGKVVFIKVDIDKNDFDGVDWQVSFTGVWDGEKADENVVS